MANEGSFSPGRGLTPGAVVLGFTVEAQIGRGAMGVVYKAHDAQGRPAAVKLVIGLEGGVRRQRFAREVEAARALDHPGVVRVLAADLQSFTPCLVMEWVDGRGLDAALADETLARQEKLRLVEQLCRAIAHAHERGIIHRDLKPQNVLVTRDGQVKVTDFGLARDLGRETRLTETGSMLGTPAWMAPELVKGDKQASAPCDVWALGVILHEALTGERPYVGVTLVELLNKLLFEPPATPSSQSDDCGPEHDAVVLRALAREPAERPSAAALGDEVARLREGREAARGASRGPLVVSGLVAVLAGAALGVLAIRAGSPSAGSPNAGSPSAGSPSAGTPSSGTPNAGSPSSGTPSGGTPSAGSQGGGSQGGGSPNAGSQGGGSPNAGSPSAGSPNAGSPNAGTPSAGSPSAGTPSAGSPSAGLQGGGSPSAGSPSAGSPSAGSPSAGSPNAGTPSAGSPSAGSPSHRPEPAPGPAAALRAQARAALAAYDGARAVWAADTALEEEPGDLEALLLRGRALDLQLDWRGAIDDLERVVGDPRVGRDERATDLAYEARLLRCAILTVAGRSPELARQELSRAIELRPDRWEARARRGLLELYSGLKDRSPDCRSDIARAAQLGPGSSEALRGVATLTWDDAREKPAGAAREDGLACAEALFSRALQVDPEDPEALQLRAWVWRDRKDVDRELADLQRAAALFESKDDLPRHLVTRARAARARWTSTRDAADLQLALTLAVRARAENTRHPGALGEAAIVQSLMWRTRLAAATTDAERAPLHTQATDVLKALTWARHINRCLPDVNHHRGLMYLDPWPGHDAERALVDLDLARRLAPDSAPVRAARAAALLELGRPEDALADAERARALDPALRDGFTTGAQALRALGRDADAEALMATAPRSPGR